jgi:hypothetical protein
MFSHHEAGSSRETRTTLENRYGGEETPFFKLTIGPEMCYTRGKRSVSILPGRGNHAQDCR